MAFSYRLRLRDPSHRCARRPARRLCPTRCARRTDGYDPVRGLLLAAAGAARPAGGGCVLRDQQYGCRTAAVAGDGPG